MDHFTDLRSEMVIELEKAGIEIELQHHEVGTAGQAEIDVKFDTLLAMADKLMLFKYVIKNVAWAAGKTATFMPKPLFGENGSGMHTHMSLFKGGRNQFFDRRDEHHLSATAKAFIAGLLVHAREMSAVLAPWVNSYQRPAPGLIYSANMTKPLPIGVPFMKTHINRKRFDHVVLPHIPEAPN